MLGILFTGIGIVGVLTPLLPGTIFLILALACFARGNQKMENWLLHHPRFGPNLQEWRATGGIRLKTKIIICSIILLSTVGTLVRCPDKIVGGVMALIGLAGILYVSTRPTLPPQRTS